MKILVMKFRNIGDVLLTTPLIDALAAAYVDARIDFACNAGTQAMIEGNPNISHIHVYEREKLRKKGLFARIWGELKFINTIKKQCYDIIIQTTSGDRGIIIARYAKARRIVSFLPKNRALARFVTNPISLPNLGYVPHTIERNLAALSALKCVLPKRKEVRIFYPDTALDGVSLPERFVHFHITSRWLFKCVKDEIMAELIDFCELELGVKVVLSGDGSVAESAKIASTLALCKSDPLNFNGLLSLKQTAALAARAMCFVGVDTAIMHVAAAVNTPVIAFFGPSGAFEWGAWDNELGENGYKMRNGVQKMGKHTIFQKGWECVPCGRDGCDGSKISRCLVEFSADEIERIKVEIRQKVGF